MSSKKIKLFSNFILITVVFLFLAGTSVFSQTESKKPANRSKFQDNDLGRSGQELATYKVKTILSEGKKTLDIKDKILQETKALNIIKNTKVGKLEMELRLVYGTFEKRLGIIASLFVHKVEKNGKRILISSPAQLTQIGEVITFDVGPKPENKLSLQVVVDSSEDKNKKEEN